jgi:hypothetical protein
MYARDFLEKYIFLVCSKQYKNLPEMLNLKKKKTIKITIYPLKSTKPIHAIIRFVEGTVNELSL